MVPLLSGTFTGARSPADDTWLHIDTGTSSTTAVTIWQRWNNEWVTSTNTTNATTTTSLYLPTSDEVWQYWAREWERGHPYPAPAEELERRQARLTQAGCQGLVIAASSEQREQWRRLEEEQRRKAEEEQKKVAEAKAKAESLLKSCLNPQQLEELERFNFFHLYVGNKKYRIVRGRAGNVKLINEQGSIVKTLCCHPKDRVPDADTMLAQKLMLETNEQEFLRIANHS